MPAPLCLNHLNIPSPDPEALRRWYVETLGLQASQGMLYGGRSVFNIVKGETLPPGTFHFGFWIDSKAELREWADKLERDGVRVHQGYADHGDYATAYFEDPDGNVFELFFEVPLGQGLVRRVRDVYVNVSDMERAVAFYRDVLGLRVLSTNEWWSALDGGGGLVLGLHGTQGAPVPRVPRDDHGAHAGAVVTLEVASVRAAVERLQAAEVPLLGEVTDNPWGILVAFEDPDGNVLKLFEPPVTP